MKKRNKITMADYTEQFNQERAKNPNTTVKKKKTAQPISEISDVEFLLAFCLAGIKDILDGLTLGILGWIINIFVIMIIGSWILFRLHKFPTKKFITAAVGDFIPLVSILPFWTGFIAIIFLEQKGYLPKWASKLAKGKV